jgi:hypothetical protein
VLGMELILISPEAARTFRAYILAIAFLQDFR